MTKSHMIKVSNKEIITFNLPSSSPMHNIALSLQPTPHNSEKQHITIRKITFAFMKEAFNEFQRGRQHSL